MISAPLFHQFKLQARLTAIHAQPQVVPPRGPPSTLSRPATGNTQLSSRPSVGVKNVPSTLPVGSTPPQQASQRQPVAKNTNGFQRPRSTENASQRPRSATNTGQRPSAGPQNSQFKPKQSVSSSRDLLYTLNEQIPHEEVRVLDRKKEMLGVMSLVQALGMANAQNSDVILVNESASPPLVRICPLSKYKYELEQTKKKAAKKQRASQQELKELKLSPRTEVHDLQVRMKKAHKELSKGNKVKLVVQFRGREMASMVPIAQDLVAQVSQHVEDVGSFEVKPKMQGRALVGILGPKK